MKKGITVILTLLIFIITITGCTLFDPKPFVAQNAPINVPVHALYALSCDNGNALVAIINTDNDSIVGIDTVGSTTERIGGFIVGPQGYIFVTIGYKSATELSNIIRVIDPATGELVKEITLNDYDPRDMIPLPNNQCLVTHPFLAWGDSLFACDMVDLMSVRVTKTLRLRGMVDDLLRLPESGDYYLAVYDPLDSVAGGGMESERFYKFDVNTGDVSNKYILMKQGVIPHFLTDTTFVSWNGMHNNRNYMIYYNFPACEKTDSMYMGSDPISGSIYIHGKYYFGTGNYPYGQNIPDDDILRVIDIKTHTLIKRIKIFSSPRQMYYSDKTDRIYIANDVPGAPIYVLDSNTDNIVDSIVTTGYPGVKGKLITFRFMCRND